MMNMFEFIWRSSHTLFCEGLVVSVLVAGSSLQENSGINYLFATYFPLRNTMHQQQ